MSTIGDSANSLLPELTSGKDFSFPDIDLNDPDFEWEQDPNDPIFGNITKLTNADLTTGEVGGSGTFDTVMTSIRAHLLDEYEKTRITGADYVKAYIELTAASLQTGASFLLQRDNAFWQAALARAQAQRAEIEVVVAKVGLQTARAQLAIAKFQALSAEVEYALGKANLAKAGVEFDTGKYQLEQILPAQKDSVIEQANAARAQTSDTRFDGQTVTGSVGKQKDLYTQQITSYQRDSEVKAAKIYSDAWTVMKTIDEGLPAPGSFANSNLDTVMNRIQINNGLTG